MRCHGRIFPPCSLSPKPMPPRSAPYSSRRASCRPPSSYAGAWGPPRNGLYRRDSNGSLRSAPGDQPCHTLALPPISSVCQQAGPDLRLADGIWRRRYRRFPGDHPQRKREPYNEKVARPSIFFVSSEEVFDQTEFEAYLNPGVDLRVCVMPRQQRKFRPSAFGDRLRQPNQQQIRPDLRLVDGVEPEIQTHETQPVFAREESDAAPQARPSKSRSGAACRADRCQHCSADGRTKDASRQGTATGRSGCRTSGNHTSLR